MNSLVKFRLCTLTDEELLKAVDAQTDALAEKGAFTRHIPARPNSDYDLLVGELVFRFHERLKRVISLENADKEIAILRKQLKEANEAIAEIEEDANNRKEQWKEERKEMREEMRNRD